MQFQVLIVAVDTDGKHVDGLDMEDLPLAEIGNVIERFTALQNEKKSAAARINVSILMPLDS